MLLVGGALVLQLLQSLDQPGTQAIDLPLTLHIIPQPRAHLRGQVGPQQVAEAVEQPLLVGQDMVVQQVGEALPLALLQGIQGLGGPLRQGGGVFETGHPVVHAEGKELAPQHLGGLEEDARGRHLAGDHLLGGGEEIEVVGTVAVRQGGGQGIAVAPPRPAHALQKAGLVGRHRAQQHGGQGADVHAHLQGGSGGEQVLVPGLGVLGLEAVFQLLPYPPRQQAGVFGGDHPPQVALAVAARPPARRRGDHPHIVGLDGIQAGHAEQDPHIRPGHRQAALPARRGQEGDLGLHHQGVRIEGQSVPLVVGGQHQDIRRPQRGQGRAIHLDCLGRVLVQQHLPAQGRRGPPLVPGGPAARPQLVEVALGA